MAGLYCTAQQIYHTLFNPSFDGYTDHLKESSEALLHLRIQPQCTPIAPPHYEVHHASFIICHLFFKLSLPCQHCNWQHLYTHHDPANQEIV